MSAEETREVPNDAPAEVGSNEDIENGEGSRLMRLYSHPWTQCVFSFFLLGRIPGCVGIADLSQDSSYQFHLLLSTGSESQI